MDTPDIQENDNSESWEKLVTESDTVQANAVELLQATKNKVALATAANSTLQAELDKDIREEVEAIETAAVELLADLDRTEE